MGYGLISKVVLCQTAPADHILYTRGEKEMVNRQITNEMKDKMFERIRAAGSIKADSLTDFDFDIVQALKKDNRVRSERRDEEVYYIVA